MADKPPNNLDAEDLQQRLERSEEALRQAQQMLAQTEKMACLGSMVADIAHEINTPVGAISSTRDTLVRAVSKLRQLLDATFPKWQQQSKLEHCLRAMEDSHRIIESGSTRVLEIVSHLRSFARQDQQNAEEADLNRIIDESLLLINHKLGGRIAIERDYEELPKLYCNQAQLHQVFLNMLVNAAQAIVGTGTIRIETTSNEATINVAISDTGSGIAPEHLAKIFEPGFTTKSATDGTGLGLAICLKIVKAHHGTINVESKVNVGTTLRIALPRLAAEKASGS